MSYFYTEKDYKAYFESLGFEAYPFTITKATQDLQYSQNIQNKRSDVLKWRVPRGMAFFIAPSSRIHVQLYDNASTPAKITTGLVRIVWRDKLEMEEKTVVPDMPIAVLDEISDRNKVTYAKVEKLFKEDEYIALQLNSSSVVNSSQATGLASLLIEGWLLKPAGVVSPAPAK